MDKGRLSGGITGEIRAVSYTHLEEIYEEEELRKSYPEYAHRIFHIFVVELWGEEQKQPREKDWQQLDSVWIPLAEADTLNLRPRHLMGRVSELVKNEFPIYMGTIHVK